MELVEIDPFHTEPPERCLTLSANRGGGESVDCLLRSILLIPDQSAFAEHVRLVGSAATLQRSSDDFLRMTEPIYRGGVDPVDPVLQRAVDRCNRGRVVLRPPLAASGCPRAESHARDFHIGGA